MKNPINKWLIFIIVLIPLLAGCRTKPTPPSPTQSPTTPEITTSGQRLTTEYYTVQEGDSFYTLAKKYQLEPQVLAAANTETGKLIPGVIIRIPPQEGAYYRWQSGDTLVDVARRFEVDPQVILDWHENAEKVDAGGEYLNGALLFIPGGKIEAIDTTLPAIETP